MIKLENMSYEALCFVLAITESQIASSIQKKKDIIDEIKRRKPFMMDKYSRGELQMEIDSFIEGDDNHE